MCIWGEDGGNRLNCSIERSVSHSPKFSLISHSYELPNPVVSTGKMSFNLHFRLLIKVFWSYTSSSLPLEYSIHEVRDFHLFYSLQCSVFSTVPAHSRWLSIYLSIYVSNYLSIISHSHTFICIAMWCIWADDTIDTIVKECHIPNMARIHQIATRFLEAIKIKIYSMASYTDTWLRTNCQSSISWF